MGTLTLRITPAGTIPLVVGNLGVVVPNKADVTLKNLGDYLESLFAGAMSRSSAGVPLTTAIRCDVNPVSATGTWTTASGSGAQTCVINGVSIGITWATSDTVSAALMATAINASVNALVTGLVTATSVAGVVTITAPSGKMGNAITTTATGTGATAGAARLTGGTDGTAQVTAAKASGTFTTSSGSGAQVVVINGASITSTWATSDTVAAAALARLILASEAVGIRGVVTATSAAGVVTVTALRPGTTGNSVTTTASGTGMTAAQAKLTGGLEAVSTRFTY